MHWRVLSQSAGDTRNQKVCAYCIALTDVDAMKIEVGGDEPVTSINDQRIKYIRTIGIEDGRVHALELLALAQRECDALNEKWKDKQ